MTIEQRLAGLGIIIFTGSSLAAFINNQENTVSTVSEALKMRDDSPVVLQGHIQQHIRKDKYLFTDSTGKITVEIDDKDWNGVDVGPSNIVRIHGEIDKDWHSTEVDVNTIKLIQ
ncbi:MAG: NirD/YgiW/YdeI family stress tolerance protein [Alphaproteobacteria bacterium]|nr:NirD/YgiW/YdeI family stress tolerance protein [Alphaproteobacteria bacterium]